ncbi:MAG: 50S ribosomal protein L24 [Deltaproteobacteria bacterium]|nr:50S ribosomal protein L24 [Deltaproteobacteria bacterium]MBI4223306.1 50S ribosomal protein L24 [Deltaproteobacteria bacterium]
MTLARIKTGDTVQVQGGREKGKTGTILGILMKKERALVEGLNKVKRHLRPRSQKEQGGVLEKEAPLSLALLMPYCTKCNRGVRVKVKRDKEGKKDRLCARCGQAIEVKKKK